MIRRNTLRYCARRLDPQDGIYSAGMAQLPPREPGGNDRDEKTYEKNQRCHE
jgi:hypothetical protein